MASLSFNSVDFSPASVGAAATSSKPNPLSKAAQNLLLHIPGEASGFYLMTSAAFNVPPEQNPYLWILAVMGLILLVVVRWIADASIWVMVTSILAYFIWMIAFDGGALRHVFNLADPWGLIIAVFYSAIVTALASAGKIK